MKSAIRPPSSLPAPRPLPRSLPLLALALLLPHATPAATYTVTDGGDDQPTGATQLRAILANSATNPGDEIHFAGVATGTVSGTDTPLYTGTTIYLSGSALKLDHPGLIIGNLTTGTVYLTGTTIVSNTTTGVLTGTITGTIAQNTTIFTTLSGSGQTHLLDIASTLTSGTLRNLHLESGSNAANGGAIVNTGGTLTIAGSRYTFSGSFDNIDTGNPDFTGTLTGTATATVNISSTLAHNTADNTGGAIYNAAAGAITLDLVTLASNTAGVSGGAIYNAPGATLDLNTATITGNAALTITTTTTGIGASATTHTTHTGEGGGIYNLGHLNLSGSSLVSSNYSGSHGGGIYNAPTGTLAQTITGISNNTTGTAGSGAGVYNAGLYTSSSATLQNNAAGDSGGGLYNSATGSLNSVFFYNNSAANNGGAIYNNGTLTIHGASNLNANTASGTHGRGGAIYNSGTLAIADASMTGNHAAEYGGAIYHDSTAPLEIANTLFRNNHAGASTGTSAHAAAGAIYNHAGTLALTDALFQENYIVTSDSITPLGGGAIYNDNGHLDITLSASTSQTHTGNYVAESGTRQNHLGGFLYMAGADATATLDIATDGTLAIGGTTSLTDTTDSIASDTASTALITKTGAGTLLLHADNTHYTGTFALQEGTLAISTAENLFGGGLSGITFTGTDGTTRIDFLATATLEGDGAAALQRLVNSATTTAAYTISPSATHTITIARNTATGTDATLLNGGALHNTGTFTLASGAGTFAFTTNTAANGGALYNTGHLDTGTSRLTFTGNTATGTATGTGHGGAIHNTGTLTLARATFTQNTAHARTTATTTTFSTTITTTGSVEITTTTTTTLIGTPGAGYGGALYNTGALDLATTWILTTATTINTDPADDTLITGTTTTTTATPASHTFTTNTAVNGGALYDTTGTLTLVNTTFDKNSATAFTTTVTTLTTITTGTETPVTATTTLITATPGSGDGGALYLVNGHLTLATHSATTTIQTTDTAGAITASTTTTTHGAITFTGNTADGYGGAIYTHGGTLTLDAAGGEINFTGNTHAQGTGTATPNAIYSATTATLHITGTHNIHLDDPIHSAALTGNTLIKDGPATLRLGGTSIWPGTAAINDGTLALKTGASLHLADPANPAATLTLSPTATLTTADPTGTATLVANHFDIHGTLHATGSATLQLTGSVTLHDAATLAVDLLSTGSEAGLVYIDGTLAHTGTTTINIAQWQGSGTFDILRVTGSDTIDTAKFDSPLLEGGLIPGVRLTATTHLIATDTDTTLQLITDTDDSRLVTWTGASGSHWSLTGTNWTFVNSSSNVETVPGDHVRFDDTAAIRDIEIISNQITTSGMTVDGTANYTFAGSGRIVTGTAYVTGTDLTPTGKLIKNGSGTLTFTNAGNDFQLGIEHNGGAITITHGDQLKVGPEYEITTGTGADAIVTTATPALTITTTATAASLHAAASLALTTPIHLDGDLTLAASGTAQFTLANTITGAANLTLATFDPTGTATIIVNGTDTGQPSYADYPRIILATPLEHTGDTIITNALVRSDADNVLSPTSHLRLTTGGTLSLIHNQTTAALTFHDNGTLFLNAAFNTDHGVRLTTGNLTATGTGDINLGLNHATQANDSILITGTATGHFKITFNQIGFPGYNYNGESIPIADTYRVIIIEGDGNAATFTADPLETAGIATIYELIKAGPDYELVRTGQPSTAAAAILNTASILGQEWHYSLDTLQRRMGDLRANPAITYEPRGNLWMRAHAWHLDATPDLSGHPFKQDTRGITIGADKAFRLGDSTLLGGIFMGGGATRRDFDNTGQTGGDGSTDNLTAGLYASWFHRDGWYADAILKADRNKNEFHSLSRNGIADHAAYNTDAIGLSLELGRHFEIDFAPRLKLPALWIEPSAQAAVAWLGGKNYVTDKGIRADLERATALQGRLQIAAGTVVATRWRPHARLGLAGGTTTGGTMRTDGIPFDPEFDGARLEAGLGLSCILNERSQLYLDYEYNKADNYKRPWSAALGFRYMW